MLKSVIQDEPLDAASNELATAREAIGTNTKGSAIRQARLKQPDLIACWASGSLPSAIAARENACFVAFGNQVLGDPQDHRRFACTANSQVANADDHPVETALS